MTLDTRPSPAGVESWRIFSNLRRLRANYEARMTPDFDPSLSLEIDRLVQQEESQS